MQRLEGQGGVRQGWGNCQCGPGLWEQHRQNQAHTHTHPNTHTCVFLYRLAGGERVEVSRHMSEFLSLCLSHSICLCLIQYSSSPIRGPCFIHTSATPLPTPALTLCGFFCVRLFALHLTYMNQSVNPIKFRAKPDGFASEPPSR